MGQWSVKKLCFDILMGVQYEEPWLNGKRSTLTYETYLKPLSHRVKRIMTLA